jgi:hypothetical protein
MQIAYTSQNFTLKRDGQIRRSFSPLPRCQSTSLILCSTMGTMGPGGGDGSIPWTKEYYYACFGVPNGRPMDFSNILGSKFYVKWCQSWRGGCARVILSLERKPLINLFSIHIFHHLLIEKTTWKGWILVVS